LTGTGGWALAATAVTDGVPGGVDELESTCIEPRRDVASPSLTGFREGDGGMKVSWWTVGDTTEFRFSAR
jgi:hypothetical protein